MPEWIEVPYVVVAVSVSVTVQVTVTVFFHHQNSAW